MRASEKAYYDKRAPDYDDWWRSTGKFAERDRPGWDAEVGQLTELIRGLEPARTLDVACGTGFLTRHLPGAVTLLDQSDTMLAIARKRLPGCDWVRADVPPLPFADLQFDRLFTSHFYGHLRDDLRSAFIDEARRVASEVVVLDAAGDDHDEMHERTLNDGSRHRVYKRWFRGSTLAAEFGGEVLSEGDWFVVVRA
jgi:demethylmenaquinone methyltransferase/2-methoxy-6-polyprenyl-1,4-benzoquinol methylase